MVWRYNANCLHATVCEIAGRACSSPGIRWLLDRLFRLRLDHPDDAVVVRATVLSRAVERAVRVNADMTYPEGPVTAASKVMQ